MPFRSSFTDTGLFGSMNIREPSLFHARGETGTIWSMPRVFCLSAENVTYAVISFVREAGSIRCCTLYETRSCPLLKSARRYAFAAMGGSAGTCWAETNAGTSSRTNKYRYRMALEKKNDYRDIRLPTQVQAGTI